MQTQYTSPRRYLHVCIAVGLTWSNDPESYTGSNSAGGRVSNAGQVKGGDAAEQGIIWSTKFGVGASGQWHHHRKNYSLGSIIIEHTHTMWCMVSLSLNFITYYTEHVYLCTGIQHNRAFSC